jgi:hypothetical protein
LLCGSGCCLLWLFAWISHTFFPESYLSANFWRSPLSLMVLSFSAIAIGVWPLLLGGNYDNIPRNQRFKPRHILSCAFALLCLVQTIVLMLEKSLPFESFSIVNSHQCKSAQQKNWLQTSMSTCVFYELFAIYVLQYFGYILWFVSLNFFQRYFLRIFVISSCIMCVMDIIQDRYITVADVSDADDLFASYLLSALPMILSGFLTALLMSFEVLHLLNVHKARRELKDDTAE